MEWICSICGYVYDGEDFTKEGDDFLCPLCDADKKAFENRDFNGEISSATKEITSK